MIAQNDERRDIRVFETPKPTCEIKPGVVITPFAVGKITGDQDEIDLAADRQVD